MYEALLYGLNLPEEYEDYEDYEPELENELRLIDAEQLADSAE